jgi:hypothetical protein
MHFLQFEDPRDVEDAIYGRDGYNNHRLWVGGTCMNSCFFPERSPGHREDSYLLFLLLFITISRWN